MNGKNPIQLRRMAAELLEEGQRIVEEAGGNVRSIPAIAQSRLRHIDRESKALLFEADELEKLEDEGRGYHGPTKPEFEGNGRGRTQERASITGYELRSGETFVSRAGAYNGPDLNVIVRGMTIGTREERDAVSGLTGASGEVLLPTFVSASILDAAFERSALVRAGARRVQMLARSHTIPRISADPVLGWRAELGVVAESKEPGIDALELVAKSVAGVAVVSMEALEDAAGLGNAVSASLTRAVAKALDAAAFAESPVSNGPDSLFNGTPIETATATWTPQNSDLAYVAAELADACGEDLGFMVVPNGDIATLRVEQASTAGSWLGTPPGMANVNLIGTNTMGTDSTYVLAGSRGDAIVVGALSDVRIRLLQERYAVSQSYASGTTTANIGGAVGFLVMARMDVGVVQPAQLLLVPRVIATT